MKIPADRQSAFQLINPNQLFGILAFITASVTTRVVSNLLMTALIAAVYMPTHGRGPALTYRFEGLQLIGT